MERAAGIILIREDDFEPKVLCLRIYNSFDLPKGRIEDNETELEAAKRETWEEAGISEIEFPWGLETFNVTKGGKRAKVVKLYIGLTVQEPHISKNPESGQYEHHGYAWLTLDEAEKKLHPYLRPAIDWVRDRLDLE